MHQLRQRPDLDQLRRQARDLLRAARAGDPVACSRILAFAPKPTLAAALHVVARDYGFESWPKLKSEVDRLRGSPPQFVIRYVRTPEELRVLWAVLNTICGAPPGLAKPHWRVFERFDEQRRRMLVVENAGRVTGGTIRLNLIAIEPWARGVGLGRRLWQTAEGEAISAGEGLDTHADADNTGFFLSLGYSAQGKSKRHMSKGVPLSAGMRDVRTRRWRDRVGDLETGVLVAPDASSGKIAPLPW